MSTFFTAFDAGLTILPVINKIDMQQADIPRVAKQMETSFDLQVEDCIAISAKTGLNVENILPAVVERIPGPSGKQTGPTRCLVFDSWFDEYRGTICLIEVVDGVLKTGDAIQSANSGKKYDVAELGLMYPDRVPTKTLFTGQVGYLIANMKTTKEARVGDTMFLQGTTVEPLPGFKPAKSMVFAGVYPVDAGQFEELTSAMDRLLLTDASVNVMKESSVMLGLGYRCGFLGMLHMDVIMQRLQQEYGQDVIATAPTVPYRVYDVKGVCRICDSPATFPKGGDYEYIEEPFINATVITPEAYVGTLLQLCQEHRGIQTQMTYLDETRVMMKYEMPLAETVVTDFYDQLKSCSRGYASFDYEEAGYKQSPIVLVEIMLNGQSVDALSFITHTDRAQNDGRFRVDKLKDVIHRHLFDVNIQAACASKVIARETVKALRKDVTAKCYGGDITRKRKLLDKQKEGKKRMRQIGSVELSQEAFQSVLRKR
eukprot:TRINITY_DN2024_c0_g1_i1.p1 TRINITY_DN2024_c0_g1~~TRINITY_DN2024_c0_g1_i1.p1  ORF type:complete len:485 (-),score=120.59 TRINITY_DN2024_c0_g1_i1:52-1506(-)